MDQENDIPSDTTCPKNIESPVLPDDVPVNSVADENPTITIETDENPTITIETDEVQTEKDLLDKGIETKDPCSPTPSNERSNYYLSPNISSKDHNSDRRLYRSTSLKTNLSDKNPDQKKEVRFADAFGVDLTEVRLFNQDCLPMISKSAFADLKVPQNSSDEQSPKSAGGKFNSKRLIFIPLFLQPAGLPHFFHRVWREKVCLENTIVNGKHVKGFIQVANLGYQKMVQVMYTTNGWKTNAYVAADFDASNSIDYSTDRFTFAIHLRYMRLGVKLAFVIKYVVNGREFWDNNFGNNYTLECVTDNS